MMEKTLDMFLKKHPQYASLLLMLVSPYFYDLVIADG
jgi:hypothetical protein